MIRALDIVLSLIGLVVGAPLFAALYVLGLFDTGSPIFAQERVGRGKRPFKLLKFRTMRVDTAHVATHLASPDAVTPLGRFLRRTKLDELPQLVNVLRGEMSLVGPRPCLFNQEELIAERESRGVFAARPGITGLAQVSGIDMSTPRLLAETDARMLADLTVRAYLGYILETVAGRGAGDRVRPQGPER
ncbi:MAG: sugar transferase [Myxococcales bacterium]|nr:sugar transferase [Myxococcales bacterium]